MPEKSRTTPRNLSKTPIPKNGWMHWGHTVGRCTALSNPQKKSASFSTRRTFNHINTLNQKLSVITEPLDQLLITGFLAVHQNAHAINTAGHPRGEDKAAH